MPSLTLAGSPSTVVTRTHVPALGGWNRSWTATSHSSSSTMRPPVSLRIFSASGRICPRASFIACSVSQYVTEKPSPVFRFPMYDTPAKPFCFLISGRICCVHRLIASATLLGSPLSRTTRLYNSPPPCANTNLPERPAPNQPTPLELEQPMNLEAHDL